MHPALPDQIGWLCHVAQIDAPVPERGAEVVNHEQRAAAGPIRFLAAGLLAAQEPLVVELVVPVAEQQHHQPQRVDVLTRRAAAPRIHHVELVDVPAGEIADLERAARKAPFDRHPLEIVRHR